MRSTALLILVLALLAVNSASAGSCAKVCDIEWWRSASSKAVSAHIAQVDPNARDKFGRTPLSYAARFGSERHLQQLLKMGGQLHTRSQNGASPLHYASVSGKAGNVKLLLKAGAETEVRDQNGETPIFWAARHGHADVSRALINSGANVTAKKEGGNTPLHTAMTARSPSVDAIRVLLEAGAKTETRNDRGQTALMYVLGGEGPRVFKSRGNNEYPDYVRKRIKLTQEIGELLLSNGAELGARDNFDQTPLHKASRWRAAGTVKILLDAGAKVDASDKDGSTPLHLAACSETVPVLIDAGADVSARNSSGATPLFLAARCQAAQNIEVLIDAGANVRADVGGRTAIQEALGPYNTSVPDPDPWDVSKFNTVVALIEAGTDPNAQDKNGETALFYAARYGNVQQIRRLLELGVDVDLRNRNGRSALHAAARQPKAKNVAALIAAGADPNARDQIGDTPLHAVARAEWYDFHNSPPRTEFDQNVFRTIDHLLSSGADDDAENGTGKNPIDVARENSYIEGTDGYWTLHDSQFEKN